MDYEEVRVSWNRAYDLVRVAVYADTNPPIPLIEDFLLTQRMPPNRMLPEERARYRTCYYTALAAYDAVPMPERLLTILESLTLAGFTHDEFTRKKNLFMHILTEKKEERERILNASLDTLLQDWGINH